MPVQDHIHLSTVVGVGVESAPDIKWKVVTRVEIPNVVMSQQRTLTGHLRQHILKDSGEAVLFFDYGYELKVYDYEGKTLEQRLAILRSLTGQFVYLVDSIHPDNGENHTSSVKTMLVDRVGDISPFTPSGEVFYVQIELIDANRR